LSTAARDNIVRAPAAGQGDLPAWLDYLERLHPSAIALGLDRVDAVRRNLGLVLECPVFTVGGTNGKGSVCALLESVLRCAGYRVGCYTSPHLLRYNERVRIDSVEAADAALVDAFERVEKARGAVSLTYFEFGTLAAALLFADSLLDAAVLEVGLGGRLDAVNVFAPDCAVITSIGIDHIDYLGDTREQIGLEKAGIFRTGRPAVVADPDPPATLIGHAKEVQAELFLIDRDFGAQPQDGEWTYWSWVARRRGLPRPNLRGNHQLGNAAATLAALDCVRDRLPVDMGAIRRALVEVELPARFQVLPGRPTVILDVAHNPHAAQRLLENLKLMDSRQQGGIGRTIAVFAMLEDKDISGVAGIVAPCVDRWLIAPLPGLRGATAEHIGSALATAGVDGDAIHAHPTVGAAYLCAKELVGANDRIVVFGSFRTVSEVLRLPRRDIS
jgi:dihydrofolate synthase/folylpolyglutamate synthase